MNALTDTFLSTVDRFSDHLGPVATLIDKVVDQIAPNVVAHANDCFSLIMCFGYCCPGGCPSGSTYLTTYVAYTAHGCDIGDWFACAYGCVDPTNPDCTQRC